jgi:hypothetical protein
MGKDRGYNLQILAYCQYSDIINKQKGEMMTVYVVQEPRGINLMPAEKYGRLQVLLPPGNVAYSAAPTVSRLKRGLARFTDEDYLLMVGDPAAIAVAGAVATMLNNGRMKVLKWDRQEMRYYVVEFDLMRRSDDY